MSAAEIVRQFYDRLGNGDVPGVLGVLAPEITWTEAEGFPYYSGTWHSPQEVVEKLLIPVSRDWDGFAARPHDFIESGNRVVTFGVYSGTAKSTGKSMRAPFAHLWSVHGGKITSFDMYTDTALVRDAMK